MIIVKFSSTTIMMASTNPVLAVAGLDVKGWREWNLASHESQTFAKRRTVLFDYAILP